MGNGFDIDVTEVRALATDLRAAQDRAMPEIRRIVQKGSVVMKGRLQDELGASEHFGQIARAVSYDTRESPTAVETEVGVSPDRYGGALENIAYFGRSGAGGSVPDPIGALHAEAPVMEGLILDALERSVTR